MFRVLRGHENSLLFLQSGVRYSNFLKVGRGDTSPHQKHFLILHFYIILHFHNSFFIFISPNAKQIKKGRLLLFSYSFNL